MCSVRCCIAALLAVLFAPCLRAQVIDSQLDDLLNTRVSTAAKYDQPMSEVAASVTVITAEEIARYGWHTLADVLSSLRGVHTTYDRNYVYLGVRGVGLPTDYNNRVLLLIDGTPLQGNIFGSTYFETTLALDLSHFARIEFVRGPSSVLYGTGAMFGVINLITRDERENASAMLGVGSDGLQTAAARSGFAYGELRGSIAASWQEKAGGDLYFPEFDHPDTNGGVVRGRDYDDYASLLATLRWRDVRVLALHSSRTKGVPTASWLAAFGADERTTDGRTTVALDYSHRLDAARTLSFEAFHDQFDYHGAYPTADGLFADRTRSVRTGAEIRHVWDIRPDHRLTLGGEVIRNGTAEYSWRYGDTAGAIGRPFTTGGLYAQLDSQPTPRLSLTAGISLDWHPRIDTKVTPRAAVIFRPNDSATLKALYGQAFRAPGIYELEYSGSDVLPARGLKAESLRSWELVWEQRLGSDVLATLSLFDVGMKEVIRLSTVSDALLQYQNSGDVASRGLELQVDHRTNDGLWSYASLTSSKAREAGDPMTNSPSTMIKAGISSPTVGRLFGGAEFQYQSSRLTLRQQRSGDVLLANVNAGLALTDWLQVTATVRNLFDRSYVTPAGPEHVQDVLEQDGRTILVRLRAGRR